MNKFLIRPIIFLVRKKLGVKKYQRFRFDNQKSPIEYYWFTSTKLMKFCNDGGTDYAHVSLNWLLDDDCRIHMIEK